MDTRLVDPSVPQRLIADLGRGVALPLFDGFAAEIRDRLATLLSANASGDEPAIRSLAHGMRSVSLEYGAIGIAAMAGEIENGQPVDPAALQTCCDRSLADILALTSKSQS